MASLEDATAIVTGASAGIGETTAHELAERGVDLTLVARRKERLASLAETLRDAYDVDVLVHAGDVRERSTSDTAIEATVDRFGSLDVVVANAGLGRGGDVETMTDEEFHAMQDTNVDGVFYLTRAALPALRASEGSLLLVGSFAGKFPRPFNPVYAATKWWVRGFAQSVAARVGDDGVAVSVINPSEVRTEFGSADGDPFEERFEPGTVTEPAEIAEAIAFAAAAGGTAPLEIDCYRRDKLADTF
ncbi:SDR family oxidoreductase [Halorubrum vacuolatum]|uniref:Ketoreductase domain-containing protein n=1 Tax=Halorubrum vacuolatum TaxID=63740 RepID=A0A238WY60_HALVU|nr:SDR family oxidoreductase [Halorubrum vacuolatum]SNR51605.1 hypothetical protein SAMN06264855_11160 [Halorubrum vacuolatum]